MPPARLVTPLILHAIKYFDAAARNRSFTRAAEELHVTQGAVSQQIRGLEEQIGAKLFTRLPRGLTLTQDGERFYRVVSKTLQELETELAAMAPQASERTLVIRSSPSFSMMWLMPRLNGFSRMHPDIEIRLLGELFGMSAARMDIEAIDVLVLYDQLTARSEQKVTPLMKEYLLPVANEDYLGRHAPIAEAADFRSRTLLHDDSPWEGAPSFAEWEEWLRAATQTDSDEIGNIVRHGHQYNLSQLAVNAAMLGQGVAMARTSLILEHLERGQLRPAVPLCVQASAQYSLVFNSNNGKNRAMQIFRDWIVEQCRQFESERDAFLSTIARLV
jgi:LysR family transcriptional regulator, glycine cleavage system transcriptional activator